ncbi:restriction endonuclease subunit S [Methanocalculus sp. MC3]
MTEQGAVPPGYKRTEVGVIPEDWEVKQIGEITSIYVGKDIMENHYSTIQNEKYQYPVFSNTVDNEGLYGYYKVFEYDGDGLTVVGRGVGVGTAFKRNGRFGAIGRLIVLFPYGTVYSNYLVYQINFSLKIFEENTGVPQLTGISLSTYYLPLPPPPEQHAIAAALSDVDGLIGALDALISKKRDMKQAAMQQLLTGRTRLPGFEGEWEEKRLGDLAEIDPENLSNSTNLDYCFNYISLEQVDNGRLIGYSEEVFRSSPSRARRKLKKGDVLMSTVRPNLMSHLLYVNQVNNAVCSTGFAVIRARKGLSEPGFLYNHLFSYVVNNQVEKIIAGSNYPAINSRDVKLIEIPCPPTLSEQTAIATVLSDMDAEIAALERRRDKAKEIKQGMMQQLLTGKVRLPIIGKEVANA